MDPQESQLNVWMRMRSWYKMTNALAVATSVAAVANTIAGAHGVYARRGVAHLAERVVMMVVLGGMGGYFRGSSEVFLETTNEMYAKLNPDERAKADAVPWHA